MAKNKNSQIDLKEWIKTHGTDFVIKVRNGKPYISKKPVRAPGRRKSPGEQRQVNLFKLAVKHAKEVIADPEQAEALKEQAAKQGRSVYHYAISDFLNKNNEQATAKTLEFDDIVVEKSGKHMFLKILFEEPVLLKKMEVWLLELDKTLVEQGTAEQATVKAWWYLIQNPDITGLPFRAAVKALDAEGTAYEAERVIV